MKLLSTILFITSLSFQYIHADMAPSYPEPGTVWKAGHQYEIVWGKISMYLSLHT